MTGRDAAYGHTGRRSPRAAVEGPPAVMVDPRVGQAGTACPTADPPTFTVHPHGGENQPWEPPSGRHRGGRGDRCGGTRPGGGSVRSRSGLVAVRPGGRV